MRELLLVARMLLPQGRCELEWAFISVNLLTDKDVAKVLVVRLLLYEQVQFKLIGSVIYRY